MCNSRTEQEETRLLPEDEQPLYVMSTEACVCIQFGLVGGLLIFGIIRYVLLRHSLCAVKPHLI